MINRFLFIVILSFTSFYLYALDISGYVLDDKSHEPIPFSNIWIKGTNQGTMTDVNGWFTLASEDNDTLCFSSVGYFPVEIPVQAIEEKPLKVFMIEDIQKIGEVMVKPEVSRAKVLFKQVLRHKQENRERLKNVDRYRSYATTTVYAAIDSASRASRFIDNLDEVTIKNEGRDMRFSPIYLAETAVENKSGTDSIAYKRKDGIFPKLNQTIESLILLNVVVDLDFYKDQINILGRGITSPLNNSSGLYYDIYLNDSTWVGDKKYFDFSFTPKNKYNPLFTGRFTVEDSSFALTKIYAYIQEEANINFVNGFKANVDYGKEEKSDCWFYRQQEISLNLALTLNKDSLTKYGSQRIDEVKSGNWLVNKTTQYSTSKRLNTVKGRNWKKQPEFASSQLAEGNYERVNKLKENTVVKGIDAIGGMVLTSYIDCGKIEVGPVFDIYSTNAIEGNRFTIPVRTGEKMFERFTVGGYLGYGTKNNGFKYGLNMAWQPQPTDKFIFRLDYYNDYNLVSQDKYLRFIKKNPNTRGNGNFIAALTSSEENPYLKEEKSVKAIMEYNADENICIEVSPYFLSSKNTPDVHFIHDDVEYNRYENYGLLLNMRLAFGQYYDKYYFARVYYIDQIPVVNLSWDIGKTYLPGGNTPDFGWYLHFHGSVTGKLNMGQTFMRYMLNGGYLLGDAPFDLLNQPVGSQSLGYAKYRYNLLHQASFAHNVYTNIHLDWVGGGIVLNRIPYVNRLKLREMISLKCHYGDLNDSYKPVFDLPAYYNNDRNEPYAEIGIGLTNIFKVLRVEYVRQLGNTYVGTGFADKNGIRFRAEMSF